MLEKLRDWFEGTIVFWAYVTLILCIIIGGIRGSGIVNPFGVDFDNINVVGLLFGAIIGFVAGAIIVISWYGFFAVIIIMGRDIERMRFDQEEMKKDLNSLFDFLKESKESVSQSSSPSVENDLKSKQESEQIPKTVVVGRPANPLWNECN